MFGDALELLGNSFDGFSWAFVDTDLSTFVCQQPIKPTSLDLASLAALSPLAEAYLHKLAMWSKKQFNLIKDEASGAVNFADESVAVKSKQRPTLRLEEIKDERQFFDCIGQVSTHPHTSACGSPIRSNTLLSIACFSIRRLSKWTKPT